jgi:hypothetical protein
MPNEVRILEFAKIARILIGSVCVVLGGVATAAWEISSSNTHVIEAIAALTKANDGQDARIGQIAGKVESNTVTLGALSDRASRNERDIQDLRRTYQGFPK